MIKQLKIQYVSLRRIEAYSRQRTVPRGLFLAKDGLKWIAMDNSTYDAWMESFEAKQQAARWLRGEFEVGDKAKPWSEIKDAEMLIKVAAQQGAALDAKEAATVLGYLEGHDYCLMADGEGGTAWHDGQYRDVHRGDGPRTVQEAIAFCQEMNWDLIQDNRTSEDYLAQLREDEQILGKLVERLMGMEGCSA